MLIILSPAKTMDMGDRGIQLPESEPLWATDASRLACIMREYKVGDLEKLFKISEKLATDNYERYQHFDLAGNPRKQAILAYNGSVFKEIGVASFMQDDFMYAQDHLRIVSTMYGLVRPLDMIQAYRLAYPLKLKGVDGNNLYEFWLPKLTTYLIEDIKKAGGILVNLASMDVLGALKMDEIRKVVKIITPEFQEHRNGRYETIRTYAKMARGAMVRYLLIGRVCSPDSLRSFEWNGFKWNGEISDEERYIFTRKR